MKRALLSVSDKTGILDTARRLQALGYEILSTGGTKRCLEEGGLRVTAVEEITRFPECFSGRVKTMHPLLLGGILLRRGDGEHEEEARKLGIEPIDIVIGNLYPFEEAAAKKAASDERLAAGQAASGEWLVVSGEENLDTNRSPLAASRSEIIEQIDIGGPTLLRSAAKNHEYVTVLCDPEDYERVLGELERKGETSLELRRELATKAFLRTAAYDATITQFLSGAANDGILLTNGTALRYGENPHQWGRFYEIFRNGEVTDVTEVAEVTDVPKYLGNACPLKPSPLHQKAGRSGVVNLGHLGRFPTWGTVLQGSKPLSYLNILDADAAWNAAWEFEEPTAVFVKHANPSGIASHEEIDEAFQRAYDADRLSAFGVVIAINRRCTEGIARKIIDQKMFVEVIVAPSYEAAALDILRKKPTIRIIEQTKKRNGQTEYRSVLGGMLAQNPDTRIVREEDLTTVTSRKLSPEQVRDLLFTWKAVKHAKSNAIVFAKDRVTVGIGAGQTSRVDATWIAAKRAGEKARGAVMASDAFFPFPDSVEEAAKHGIAAIIQPGGSIRDREVFAKAEELGIAMLTTGIRAFRH